MKNTIACSLLAGATALAGAGAHLTTPTAPIVQEVSQTAMTGAECTEGHVASALFAPGTDPKVVERVSLAIQNLSDTQRFETTGRWPGASGEPVNLTYSFPSDGLSIPNGIGEGTNPNTLHATLNARFGSEPVWQALFVQIFDDWAAATGNTYTLVSDDDAAFFNSPGPLNGGSGRGDVRIVAKPMDGGSGVLAYNFFPGATGGEMVLDSAEFWNSGGGTFRFFRNTLAHEHGHGLGILHVCPIQQTKLMEPFLTTAFDGIQHDDIRAAQFLYGDRLEPNQNSGEATDLGVFSADGGGGFDDLCIRNNGDDDVFAVELTNSGTISATASPFGFSYSSGPQTQACNSGTAINSMATGDLVLEVLDTDGSTVLATADATAAGSAESLAGVVAPAAGTYYIRVQGAFGFVGNTQTYDMDFSVTVDEVLACIADLNNDGVVDTADLGILIGVFGTNSPLADLNDDNIVDTADLGILIGVFGTCTTE